MKKKGTLTMDAERWELLRGLAKQANRTMGDVVGELIDHKAQIEGLTPTIVTADCCPYARPYTPARTRGSLRR
jgi:hypothetical protein